VLREAVVNAFPAAGRVATGKNAQWVLVYAKPKITQIWKGDRLLVFQKRENGYTLERENYNFKWMAVGVAFDTGLSVYMKEWGMIKQSEASPRKRMLLEERYQNLWGSLDKVAQIQMRPLAAENRKPPKDEKLKTSGTISPPPDLSHVDILTGVQFEKFIGNAFEQKGYTVEYHGGPTEAGGDLVCWEGSADQVHAILVQVKRERCLTGTKAIGQILRKENWFRHRYPKTSYEKWVITSSRFSRQAIMEAEGGGIVLVDHQALQDWLAGQ
jgi:Restriction endonuclease